MSTVRRSAERGHFNFGWLDTYHTFSFGDYHNPMHMGFRTLRVINEDWVAPGKGFPTHAHHDMEIISYVLSGALAQNDSLGATRMIRPGEILRMSAGTGVQHSEFNASNSETTHFLQLWMLPARLGLAPSYEQQAIPAGSEDPLTLLASPDGAEGSVTVHQDALLWLGRLGSGDAIPLPVTSLRYGWLQMLGGQLQAGEHRLQTGDGLAIEQEDPVTVVSRGESEFLLFDLS
jgi:quercetin 2,3-dioxygenase